MSESESNPDDWKPLSQSDAEQHLLIAYRRVKRELLPLEYDTLVRLAVEGAEDTLPASVAVLERKLSTFLTEMVRE